MNSCPLFSSSRIQKIISLLSSREAEVRAIVSSASAGLYTDKGGPVHLHRFFERAPAAPTCDEERSWKSETVGWKAALDSEQKRLQYGASANR